MEKKDELEEKKNEGDEKHNINNEARHRSAPEKPQCLISPHVPQYQLQPQMIPQIYPQIPQPFMNQPGPANHHYNSQLFPSANTSQVHIIYNFGKSAKN